jgi:DnaK suppressor protein
MTKSELKKFRGILQARQTDLEKVIRNREGLAIETSADELDRTQYATEREIKVGDLERDSALLRDVRAALGRVETGTFGSCLSCENEINPKRLAAVPWTPCCLTCQEAADQDSKNFRDAPGMGLVHAA